MADTMNDKGFTVLELALVIIIAGVLMIPAFRTYDTYLYGKRVTETRENLAKIQSEISIFLIKEGRYPCPSNRSVGPDDPGFGLEDCSVQALGAGNCTDTTEMGLCKYVSDKNTDGLPGNEAVLFGGVPFLTLADVGDALDPTTQTEFRRIASREILDGWKNQISYAVTESQTIDPAIDPDAFDDDAGVIRMVDEHGNDIGKLGPDPLTTDDDQRFHFALIAHGRDGFGTYTASGTRLEMCSSGVYGEPGGPTPDAANPPGTSVNLDVENCNANATFIMGLDNSDAEGASHFDDLATYGNSDTSALWDSTRDALTGNRTPHITNLNTGNVGFGTDTPLTTLDVAGAIKADSSIRTNQICDQDGNNCFDPAILTTTPDSVTDVSLEGSDTVRGISCAEGRAMVGISNAQEQCIDIVMPSTLLPDQRCPDRADGTKTWLRGIRTNGTIECTN